MKVVPVILCGGSGTRLWPLSRADFPKQFLVLSGNHRTLFQQTVDRLAALKSPELLLGDWLIVANEEHRFLVLDQLRACRDVRASLLLEPMGRNTAPALTLAALQATASGEDPLLVVAPADQTIGDLAAFVTALHVALRTADSGAIVILGVPPERPETGFGYILHERPGADDPAPAVVRFVEKPDIVTACAMMERGDHLWNSGMFVLKASAWLNALGRFRPDILEAVRVAWMACSVDGLFIRPDRDGFAAVPAESIDYAVMERCPGAGFPLRMVPLDAGWNDLGGWNAVWLVGEHDANGNVTLGDVIAQNSRDSLILASSRLVGTVGVNHLIIVETPDAVLVADRANCQEVKQLVASLGEGKRTEFAAHRKVHRPWGWYDAIDRSERFQVKRIQVKPGASLSLQMHHHRAEHWIVVRGTAAVTCGDETQLLTENQSTYIPIGTPHRLANPGTIPLEIIEVQSGSYLGEDDIVRFDDTYGRVKG
ncbi:MAG: mannose-1-phosphate guanylyltransferase/mannose-6-phosphate isomerase [Magnetococcus sp. YQC-9]